MLMNRFEVWENGLTSLIPYREWIIRSRVSKFFSSFANNVVNKTVLEIGSGSGAGARVVNRYFFPKNIIASELDSRLVETAKRYTKDTNILFEQQDAAILKYKNNTFDAVFDFKVIHHIPNPQWKHCLNEVYWVLRRGGKFFIIDQSIESFETLWGRILRLFFSHPYDSLYTKQEFTEYLKKIGYKILLSKQTHEYFVIVVEKRTPCCQENYLLG